MNKYEYNPELLLEDLSIIISGTITQLIHYISDTNKRFISHFSSIWRRLYKHMNN